MNATALDVSSNNHAGEPFNWQDAIKAGYNVVYIKATQGVNYLNPYCIQDCRDAKNAGFDVGVYHFLDNTAPPNDQAVWFINNGIRQCEEYCTLLPLVDDEVGNPTGNERETFITKVKSSTSNGCGQYMDRSFYEALGPGNATFTFLANPGWDGTPTYPRDVAMVQTGNATIPGIGDNANGPQLPTDISIVLNLGVMMNSANQPVSKPLNAPIVGGALCAAGGYWLVGADGGVFAFGNAKDYGVMAGQPLQRPICGIVGSATGLGYMLVGRDGGTFCFGDFVEEGSLPALGFSPAPTPANPTVVA